jgi:hypothetical protein
LKIWARWLTAAAMAAGLVPAVALPASAMPLSAHGCNSVALPWQHVGACVWVQGVGTYVDAVRGGINIRAGAKQRGYFEIWDTNRASHFRISTIRRPISCNPTRRHPGACWDPVWFKLERDLPPQSQVCALFISTIAQHHTTQYGPACKTISRPLLR